MTTGPLSQCGTCMRLQSPFNPATAAGVAGPWCEAFPEGIPANVYDNTVDHRQPITGDHGLQWAARPGATYPNTTLPPDVLTAATTPPTANTGAMIALLPTADWAETAAVEEGLPAGELHITLAFLGEANQLSPETQTQVLAACQQTAAQCAPLQAEGFAVSLFNPTGTEPCVVLGLTGDDLANLHDQFEQQLGAAGIDLSGQHRPWIPHITLTYTDDHYAAADVVDRCGPVPCDRLRVAFGDQVTDFALGQPGVVDDETMQPMNPPPAADASPCPPGQHQMPDGTCMDDTEMMDSEELHLAGKHNQRSHGHARSAGPGAKLQHGGRVGAVPRGGYKVEHRDGGGRPTRTAVYDKNNELVKMVVHSTGLNDAEVFALEDLPTMPESDAAAYALPAVMADVAPAGGTQWHGVAVVEGEWSGDGRQFVPGAIEWEGLLPEPLLWQPQRMPDHDGDVITGRVDGVMRQGPRIQAWGVFDDDGEYGAEALRLIDGGFLKGLSARVDDVDTELICPLPPRTDADDDGDDGRGGV